MHFYLTSHTEEVLTAAGLTYSALKDLRLAADFTGVAVQDTVAEITVQYRSQQWPWEKTRG